MKKVFCIGICGLLSVTSLQAQIRYNQVGCYPHHRISDADAVEAPLLGMLVGGPNPGQQHHRQRLEQNLSVHRCK